MYLYYAIFSKADDGISVEFPGIEGAYTCGEDMHEALYMAKDLLAGLLIDAQDDNEELPKVREVEEIKANMGDLVIPIEVNLDMYRAKYEGQLIKKTLTIPKYLNIAADNEGINFSATLSEALKEKLGV